ncbi:MAG TPA: hypothetical protein VHW71_11255 [Steroidobacteraceae bacterium]|nr:hypothetical protein [Steroidobacteraceae bacterium]
MNSSNALSTGPILDVEAQKGFGCAALLLGDAAYCPSPLSGQGTSRGIPDGVLDRRH